MFGGLRGGLGIAVTIVGMLLAAPGMVPLDALLALGRANPADAGEPFNMAYLAMRGSCHVNGVAQLHGKSIRERARALINIAHPKFRDELRSKAQEYGYL